MRFCKFSMVFLSGFSASLSWGAAEFKEAEITTIKNMVEHDAGGGATPAKVNEKIQEKSKVSTAAASMAELTFADSSITRMGANTQFSFQSKERLVKLEQGSVLVNTPPGKGGAVVDCGGVTGAVSGTTFMATRDASGGVMFVMLEGSGTLKVTVPTAGGGAMVKEIRPGQAASVGSASVKAAAEATGGGKPPASPPGAEPETGSTKPAAKADAIQVFDVDVKKIVETAPLIREFKTELPSMEKIEKTIEVQQTAVKEGKLEKLEVEVVALKADGDVLVGAPKVEKEEFIVVNRKAPVNGPGGNDLDVDTAAGPGMGGGNVADGRPAPGPKPAAPATPAGVVSSGTLGIIGQNATVASGGLPDPTLGSRAPEGTVVLGDPINPLALTLSGPLKRDGVGTLTITMAGVTVTKAVAVKAGTTQFEILGTNLPDPKVLAPDGVEAKVTLALSGAVGTIAETITLASRPIDDPVVQAANPARKLYSSLNMPDAEKTALDIFFYFQSKGPGVNQGPDKLFADPLLQGVRDFQAVIQDPAESIPLFTGQTHDFFAAQKFSASPGDLTLSPTTPTFSELVVYANQWVLGQAGAARWEGLADPLADDTSLGYRSVDQNRDYAPIFNSDLTAGPIGFFDAAGDPYGIRNFPVWDDESAGSFLVSAYSWSLTDNAKTLTLVAGAGGGVFEGLDLQANGNRVEILSVGDLKIATSRIRGLEGTTANAGLILESTGKLKMGGLTEAEQVRLQGTETAAGLPSPGNLAILRTGDSLEIRNLTLRSFGRVELEKPGSTGGGFF